MSSRLEQEKTVPEDTTFIEAASLAHTNNFHGALRSPPETRVRVYGCCGDEK